MTVTATVTATVTPVTVTSAPPTTTTTNTDALTARAQCASEDEALHPPLAPPRLLQYVGLFFAIHSSNA